MTDKDFAEFELLLQDMVAKKKDISSAVYNEWMREKGKRDLFFLNTQILGYDLCVKRIQGSWDKIVDADYKRVLLMVAREHYKTMYVTVGKTIKNLINDNNIRQLLVSATLEEAKGFLRAIQDHLQHNRKFIDIYGDYTELSSKWTETSIVVNRSKRGVKEPSIHVMGVEGNIVGDHYDFGIVDDPCNLDDAESPSIREKKKRWFRKLPPILKRMIVIGTPWHYNDLYAEIQEREALRETQGKEKRWYIVKRPAILENGEPYFPEQFTLKKLDDLKDEMLADYTSQYLLDPVPKGEGDFNSDWLIEYTDMPENVTTYQVIDLASSQSKRADFFVIFTVGVTKSNDIYIKNIFRKRIKFTPQTKKIKQYYHFHKPIKIWIDEEGYQKVMGQYMETDDFGKLLPLKGVPRTKGEKTDKIAGISPVMEKGVIHIPRGAKWVQDFKDEVDRFPKGHDDQLDCLYMLITMLQSKKSKFLFGFPNESKSFDKNKAVPLSERGQSEPVSSIYFPHD